MTVRISSRSIRSMRWLLHGDLTAAGEALKRHGQNVVAAADAGLAHDSPPADFLETARVKQLEVITADAVLVDAAFGPGALFWRTLVFLHVDAGEVEQDDAIDRLFARYKRLSPGRLYTVTNSRVKVRQLPK